MAFKKLPVGIEDFSEMVSEDYYYIDKTGFIGDLLRTNGKVNLFTRPRRFGKTLNMSMLQNFFDINRNQNIFSGLDIEREQDICEKYMGQYPVIFMSMKGIEGFDFEDAKSQVRSLIAEKAAAFDFLEKSEKLNLKDFNDYQSLLNETGHLGNSLKILSRLLYKHYNKKVIILIDEYDVPLDKAYSRNYYDEMVFLLRQIYGAALKTNEYLEFAVLTGCLRISKESIFTGLNNFIVNDITEVAYDEAFGFTDAEVISMLKFYNLMSHYNEIKRWYNGYRFGRQGIYCPWDVINYVRALTIEANAEPQDYWVNTSGNEMVRHFIDMADGMTRDDIERLINGESVFKKIKLDLTYAEVGNNIENLWSVLFATGYLTWQSKREGIYELVIPNEEIRDIYENQIQKWFEKKMQSDTRGLEKFCQAFVDGDTIYIENYLNQCLAKSIGIQDTKIRNTYKENFYHGLLVGLLNSQGNYWTVLSNREVGDGYADIIVYCREEDYGFILELKYVEDFNLMEKKANDALKQIDDRNYKQFFVNEGINHIQTYGIAFCRKKCVVKKFEDIKH